ncbi:hypothetical protein BH10CYA1_BH10CYA1_56490 [soil metagenome]
MSDYIAFFASPASFEEFRKFNWDSPDEVDALFERMRSEEGLERLWGGTTDSWLLSGLSDWMTKKLKLPTFGSTLGAQFVSECEYVHWVMDHEAQMELKKKMESVDPREDPSFEPTISEFFEALGLEYVETYVDQSLDEYYQIYDDLKSDLATSKNETLVVLIPY